MSSVTTLKIARKSWGSPFEVLTLHSHFRIAKTNPIHLKFIVQILQHSPCKNQQKLYTNCFSPACSAHMKRESPDFFMHYFPIGPTRICNSGPYSDKERFS